MRLARVAEALEGKILTPKLDWQNIQVEKVCSADLMSDVLAFSEEKSLLLTGLIYPQVIRTAEILDIKAIVFVNGKVPPSEVIALAEQQGVPLFTTNHSMYRACGLLHKEGIGARGGEASGL